MRRLVLTLIAALVLASPASALADPAGITLSDTGFAPTTAVVKPGEAVTFTNSSLAEGVRFDDEVTTRCQAPIVPDDPSCARTFDTAGVFKFFDPAQPGCTSYDACPDPFRGTVTVDGPPSVTSVSAPAAATRGESVGFAATATDPNGDAISSFNWDFGDGTGATTSDGSAAHAYTAAGNFTITVTAVDARGNVSAPAQVAIDIRVPDGDGDGINDDADACPTVAAATPDGCPLVAPVVPPRIKSSMTTAGELGVTGALNSGVNALLNCSGACTGTFTLTRSGRALALPVQAALPDSGSKLVTVKFTNAAKRSLKKLTSARLQLQVVVADSVGRLQTRKATVVLKVVRTLGRLPAVGISDNQPTTFSDPNFEVLRLHYARLVTPWNSVFSEPARLDAWLQAARAHGIRPLVSFEHTRGMACPGRHCKGPSTGRYARAWKAFHKKYPWVKDISPWNEVNSATQPTGTRPDLAAAYYNVVRANCRGCTIVAADLLDGVNIRRYTYAFLLKAKDKPRLWGLHNYTDTNRFRSQGTNALLQSVQGTVWLTETGGVVRFVTQKGVVALPRSESRAKKAMDYMFRLAELNSNRIKRIYVYQWKVNNPFDRFDAGVVSPNGKKRPSYDVLSVNASIARKR